MSEALKELMGKHAATTPGDWHVWGERDWLEAKLADFVVIASDIVDRNAEGYDDNAKFLLNIGGPIAPMQPDEADGNTQNANANFIAAAHNTLPAIAQDFAALRAEAEMSRRAEAETAETLNSVQQVLFDAGCFSATRSVVDNAKALRAERDAAVKRAEAAEELARYYLRHFENFTLPTHESRQTDSADEECVWRDDMPEARELKAAALAAGCKLDGDA